MFGLLCVRLFGTYCVWLLCARLYGRYPMNRVTRTYVRGTDHDVADLDRIDQWVESDRSRSVPDLLVDRK